MKSTKFLIIGAGVSGISTAGFLGKEIDYRILEKSESVGGYCKTIKQDGFTWDYSGHFFHFRSEQIKNWVMKNIDKENISTVRRKSGILYKGSIIDFPFQKNIHQLPKTEFIECLRDFHFRIQADNYDNLLESIYGKLGRSIVDKFIKPYNEKLYAIELAKLDVDAMGRFFPNVTMSDLMDSLNDKNMDTYNSSFLYPKDGAISYINSLMTYVDESKVDINTEVQEIDMDKKIAKTSKGVIRYEKIVSSIPLDRLLRICNIEYKKDTYTSNKVLVYNLGFDLPSSTDIHWLYIPDSSIIFYRVGFYDNILRQNKMSLYVEIGCSTGEKLDIVETQKIVLAQLKDLKIITNQSLISSNFVWLDPAYVHISKDSIESSSKHRALLESRDIFSLGRYGEWTYCSIEDNIISASAVVKKLTGNDVVYA